MKRTTFGDEAILIQGQRAEGPQNAGNQLYGAVVVTRTLAAKFQMTCLVEIVLQSLACLDTRDSI